MHDSKQRRDAHEAPGLTTRGAQLGTAVLYSCTNTPTGHNTASSTSTQRHPTVLHRDTATQPCLQLASCSLLLPTTSHMHHLQHSHDRHSTSMPQNKGPNTRAMAYTVQLRPRIPPTHTSGLGQEKRSCSTCPHHHTTKPRGQEASYNGHGSSKGYKPTRSPGLALHLRGS